VADPFYIPAAGSRHIRHSKSVSYRTLTVASPPRLPACE
jgi:hypothetical protein